MHGIKDGRYGVIWLLSGYGFSVGMQREKVDIGICRATNEVAFFGIGLQSKTADSLRIERGKCEEGERCLYCNCPFNRTTWSTYKTQSSFGKGVKSLQGFKGLVALRNEVHHALLQVPDMGDWLDREQDVSRGYMIEVEEPIIVSGVNEGP